MPADATLACRVRHPNIAATYEMSEVDDSPYWAIEYLHGKPLDEVLAVAARRGGLPLQLGLWISASVLRALDYAHHLKEQDGAPLTIVHGDVRPHNVFLSYAGEVKLLDFCVARRPTKRGSGAAEPEHDDVFCAPETALGLHDASADIYSAGRLLEALAAGQGSTAWLGSSTLPGLQAALGHGVGSLLEGPLRAVCERATRRDPSTRHASAAALLSEVEGLLQQVLIAESDPDAAMRDALAAYMQQAFAAERDESAARLTLLRASAGASTAAADSSIGAQTEVEQGAEGVSVNLLDAETIDDAEARPHSAPSPSEPPPRLSPMLPPPLPKAKVVSQPTAEDRGAGYAMLLALLATMALIGTKLTPPTSASAASAVTPAIAVTAAAATPAEAVVEPATKAEPDLRLCGSNTMGAELAPALVKGLFAHKANAESVVSHHDLDSGLVRLATVKGDVELAATISARGSTTAFKELANESCDIGMSSRSITSAEIEELKALGRGDLGSQANEHVVALDGVAVIVHPNNPVTALDTQALHGIFTGEVKDWSQVGGTPGAIHLYARDENSGTFDLFKELVLRELPLAEETKRYALSDALSDAVASDPAAIGFIGLPYVRTARALAVGEPGSTPLLPTRSTVATESYALSRRLYLYTTDQTRSPWVTELLNFALSARGQRVVAETEFVNLSLVTEAAQCGTLQCPLRYAALVAAARRISLDLRFKLGGNQPDNRARRDLDRLSSFLLDYHDPKLLLLGFSDNLGDPALNLQLSTARAESIAQELKMRGVQPSVVTGFGAALPVASNDSERGRARNRRVEVWVEDR